MIGKKVKIDNIINFEMRKRNSINDIIIIYIDIVRLSGKSTIL